jgi:hypothetical protein
MIQCASSTPVRSCVVRLGAPISVGADPPGTARRRASVRSVVRGDADARWVRGYGAAIETSTDSRSRPLARGIA